MYTYGQSVGEKRPDPTVGMSRDRGRGVVSLNRLKPTVQRTCVHVYVGVSVRRSRGYMYSIECRGVA